MIRRRRSHPLAASRRPRRGAMMPCHLKHLDRLIRRGSSSALTRGFRRWLALRSWPPHQQPPSAAAPRAAPPSASPACQRSPAMMTRFAASSSTGGLFAVKPARRVPRARDRMKFLEFPPPGWRRRTRHAAGRHFSPPAALAVHQLAPIKFRRCRRIFGPARADEPYRGRLFVPDHYRGPVPIALSIKSNRRKGQRAGHKCYNAQSSR